MEFPPVQHLIDATFDAFKVNGVPDHGKAPEPVANSKGLEGEGPTRGSREEADKSATVGTRLDATA